MIPFILLLLFTIFCISIFVWLLKEDLRQKSEKRLHEKNLAIPYRIVKVGVEKFRIQAYQFFPASNGIESEWRWVTVISKDLNLSDAKNTFCNLLAQHRYAAEVEAKAEAERLNSAKEFMDGLQVHDIIDMSDTTKLCEEIIQKLRDSNEKRELESKPCDGDSECKKYTKKRTRKKKASDESREN